MTSSTLKRLFIIPDTHSPYHDKRAWDLAMQVAGEFKPDTVIHLGDWGDFYKISRHSKDPGRSLSFTKECEITRGLRAQVDALKPERKVFIEGNHEDRLAAYLRNEAPALHGTTNTDKMLELTANGWEFVPYRDHIKIGRVYFTHDTGGGGKYSTMHALDTFQHSVVIGHHHAVQYYVAGDVTGKYRVGAQFGWLGDIKKVDYMHAVKVRRLWSLGFGIGYHDTETGLVYLQPVPIINYTACVEGKVYRG